MDALSQETIATIVGVAIIAGFLWSLHRDVAGLRERMSRLEGLFEGVRDSFIRFERRFDRLERRFDDRFPPSPAAGG